MKLRINNEVTI